LEAYAESGLVFSGTLGCAADARSDAQPAYHDLMVKQIPLAASMIGIMYFHIVHQFNRQGTKKAASRTSSGGGIITIRQRFEFSRQPGYSYASHVRCHMNNFLEALSL